MSSAPLICGPLRAPGHSEDPIYGKYTEFLKLSNPIYFEFLRCLQTLRTSDENTQGGSEDPITAFEGPRPPPHHIDTQLTAPPALDSRLRIECISVSHHFVGMRSACHKPRNPVLMPARTYKEGAVMGYRRCWGLWEGGDGGVNSASAALLNDRPACCSVMAAAA